MPLALYPEFGLRDLGGDAATVSLLHSATAFGALLASLTSGWAARTARSGRVLIVAVLVWGAAMAMLGVAPGLAAALLCIAVAGMGLTIAEILRGAMLQQATPDHLLGRVGSLWSMQATLAPALGGMIAALLARPLGAGAAIALGGVLCLAGTLLVAAGFPELRRAGARP
jgi:ENTS family enterobactin (siderophore) exporter